MERNLFLSADSRIMNATATNGRKAPDRAETEVSAEIICVLNSAGFMPSCSRLGRKLELMVSTGVPTAPNGTASVLQTSDTIRAAITGKPSPTSSGAASAGAAPNPAAPSMKLLNSQAMMIACIRRSSER